VPVFRGTELTCRRRLFLSIATYIVYGSWLNYSRYGARGFDAVPHADTLRDIPFIVKDVVRKMQGGGSRGGYSAV
jgi:autophagy-related protein 27